jgi:hypothetical protein
MPFSAQPVDSGLCSLPHFFFVFQDKSQFSAYNVVVDSNRHATAPPRIAQAIDLSKFGQ